MFSIKTSSLGIVSAIAILLLANLAYAGGTKVSSGRGICTYHQTFLFLDGQHAANAVTCMGTDPFAGPYQSQDVAGWVWSGHYGDCTMSNGHGGMKFTLDYAAGARNYPNTLDQLFYEGGSDTTSGFPLTDGTYCFNPQNYTFEGTVNYNVIGGTGPYEGATGTMSIKFHGSVLGDDPVTFGSSGQFVYTSSSSITTK